MKPMMILPPGAIDVEGIKLLNENGICTVVANDPAKVKFLDPVPIPPDSSRSQIENAAIKLSRIILDPNTFEYLNPNNSTQTKTTIGRQDILRIFVEALVNGTALDTKPTMAERHQQLFDETKGRRNQQDCPRRG